MYPWYLLITRIYCLLFSVKRGSTGLFMRIHSVQLDKKNTHFLCKSKNVRESEMIYSLK